MPRIPVHFEYWTGLRRRLFTSARLTGSWDADGLPAGPWSTVGMEPFTADDGCPAFRASVALDDGAIGGTFRWGVWVATPDRPSVWGIAAEVNDPNSTECVRQLTLAAAGQTERYLLTQCR